MANAKQQDDRTEEIGKSMLKAIDVMQSIMNSDDVERHLTIFDSHLKRLASSLFGNNHAEDSNTGNNFLTRGLSCSLLASLYITMEWMRDKEKDRKAGDALKKDDVGKMKEESKEKVLHVLQKDDEIEVIDMSDDKENDVIEVNNKENDALEPVENPVRKESVIVPDIDESYADEIAEIDPGKEDVFTNFAFERNIGKLSTQGLSTLDHGWSESGPWHNGGFEWRTTMSNCDNFVRLNLFCGLPTFIKNQKTWNCEAEISCYIAKSNGTSLSHSGVIQFSETVFVWWHLTPIKWQELSTFENYNEKITIEFRVKIISSIGGDIRNTFSSTIDANNVTVRIGNKRLNVSKGILAKNSPVFNAMLIKNSKKRKKELKIKNVNYEEFVQLLLVLSPNPVAPSDETVLAIIELAKRFQIEGILTSAEKHLQASEKFSIVAKLEFADTHRFNDLRDHCLQSIKSLQDLKVLKEAQNFSDNMKVAICDRMMQLLQQ